MQMVTVMKHVASRQNFRIEDESVVHEIARDAEGNLRKALLVFEALKMQTYAQSRLSPCALC